MTFASWKTHVPLLRIFLILLALMFAAGSALAAFEQGGDTVPLDSSGWQWAPASSMEETVPPTDGWQRYKPVAISHKYYWLRVPLPRQDWKDPALFMLQINGIRLFAAGRMLYENDPFRLGVRVNGGFYWHMSRLPVPLPDHADLLLRNGLLSTQNPLLEVGEKAVFVSRIFHKDLDNVILGSLLLFCCFISLGLYASQRDRLYLYFALLAFSGGYASLVGNQLISFIWRNPWVSFLQETAMPWATFAVVGALEQVFPGVNRVAVRWLRRFVLAFCVFATAGAFISVYVYTFWTSYLYTPVFLAMFCISYHTIWSAYRSRKELESVWIMAGFTSLVAIAFVHVLRYWLPPSLAESWSGLLNYLNTLPDDLIYLGLFAFVVCLIRVIVYRYTSMNRQLTEFNRSLEQLVEMRTQEIRTRNRQLEEANRELEASQREAAEAMAESMMLEERHRITGAIHDKVGHTLSAAIIQLEAAKRLMPADRLQAEEKLDASQELARRGLEDIRQSVRLMRENAGHYDLPGAIGALVRETERTAGCSFDVRIGPLPDTLTVLQKRILFQALQEGLSHVIRFGEAKRFSFDLFAESGMVRFLLTADIASMPPLPRSFGLQAVMDRVAGLGGQLRWETTAQAASLALSLPA